jgi:hypothetical protein
MTQTLKENIIENRKLQKKGRKPNLKNGKIEKNDNHFNKNNE